MKNKKSSCGSNVGSPKCEFLVESTARRRKELKLGYKKNRTSTPSSMQNFVCMFSGTAPTPSNLKLDVVVFLS
jgi:hypothetical protein